MPLPGVEFTQAVIAYTIEKLTSSSQCGIIDTNYFTTTTEHFTESQNHNTCLNRKLGIDVGGNIKNCPSLAISFGNVATMRLDEAIEHPEFRKLWGIKKADISICKDCEFRHICTDCRAFIANPNDLYSPPLKCGYDPYTATFSDWNDNPLKQSIKSYYKI